MSIGPLSRVPDFSEPKVIPPDEIIKGIKSGVKHNDKATVQAHFQSAINQGTKDLKQVLDGLRINLKPNSKPTAEGLTKMMMLNALRGKFQ